MYIIMNTFNSYCTFCLRNTSALPVSSCDCVFARELWNIIFDLYVLSKVLLKSASSFVQAAVMSKTLKARCTGSVTTEAFIPYWCWNSGHADAGESPFPLSAKAVTWVITQQNLGKKQEVWDTIMPKQNQVKKDPCVLLNLSFARQVVVGMLTASK